MARLKTIALNSAAANSGPRRLAIAADHRGHTMLSRSNPMNLCARRGSQHGRRLQRGGSRLWRVFANQRPLRPRFESLELRGEPLASLLRFSEVLLGHTFPMRHSGVESRYAAFDGAATDIVAVFVAFAHG
jgi:hypothetical protein